MVSSVTAPPSTGDINKPNQLPTEVFGDRQKKWRMSKPGKRSIHPCDDAQVYIRSTVRLSSLKPHARTEAERQGTREPTQRAIAEAIRQSKDLQDGS
jgi:hypothetical protein